MSLEEEVEVEDIETIEDLSAFDAGDTSPSTPRGLPPLLYRKPPHAFGKSGRDQPVLKQVVIWSCFIIICVGGYYLRSKKYVKNIYHRPNTRWKLFNKHNDKNNHKQRKNKKKQKNKTKQRVSGTWNPTPEILIRNISKSEESDGSSSLLSDPTWATGSGIESRVRPRLKTIFRIDTMQVTWLFLAWAMFVGLSYMWHTNRIEYYLGEQFFIDLFFAGFIVCYLSFRFLMSFNFRLFVCVTLASLFAVILVYYVNWNWRQQRHTLQYLIWSSSIDGLCLTLITIVSAHWSFNIKELYQY